MRLLLLAFICLLGMSAAAGTKKLVLASDDLAEIHLKLGYSTKLVFETEPEPGIIGDQDAFAVEYLGKVVAIKPLLPNVSTNLFVPLKKASFNFHLITSGNDPDDLVYIKQKPQGNKDKELGEASLVHRPMTRGALTNDFRLVVGQLSWPKSLSSIIIDLVLLPQNSEVLVAGLNSSHFELCQVNECRKAIGIYLTETVVSSLGPPVIGKLLFRADELDQKSNFSLKVILGDLDKKTELKVAFPPMKTILDGG